MPEFVHVFGGLRFDAWDWKPESAPEVVVDLFANWPARLSYLFNGKASVAAYYPGDVPTRGRYCAAAAIGSTLAAIAAKRGPVMFADARLPVSFDGRAAAEAGLAGPGIWDSLDANWDGLGLAITASVYHEHVDEVVERIGAALLMVAAAEASRVRFGWLDVAERWRGMVWRVENRHDLLPFQTARWDGGEAGVCGYHPLLVVSGVAADRLGGPLTMAQNLGDQFAVARAHAGAGAAVVVRFVAGPARFGVAERRLLRSVIASELNLAVDLSRSSSCGAQRLHQSRLSWILAEDWIVGPPPAFEPAPPWVVAEGD